MEITDKQRLDFLYHNYWIEINNLKTKTFLLDKLTGNILGFGRNPREAIDAAIMAMEDREK